MSQEQGFCSVCDHKIIPGVACDGMPDECPLHAARDMQRDQTNLYAITVDSMTGQKDFDSVKSID